MTVLKDILKPSGMLFVIVIAGLASCGGPAATGGSRTTRLTWADVDRTADWASRRGYRYCNINDDRVCLSPDSVLEFQFPRNVNDSDLESVIQADLILWNESPDTVGIVAYSITAVDDSNQTYQAELSQPEELQFPDHLLDPLTLQADQRVRLPFSIELTDVFRRITRIVFHYRTGEMAEPMEIAVTYGPDSIFDDEERR